MKHIKKALWPTAIVAAALMLFGALGNAVNADKVTGTIEKDGDTIYVVVAVDGDLKNVGPTGAEVSAAKAKVAADAAKVAADAAKVAADAIVKRIAAALTKAAIVDAATDAIAVGKALDDAAAAIKKLDDDAAAAIKTIVDDAPILTDGGVGAEAEARAAVVAARDTDGIGAAKITATGVLTGDDGEPKAVFGAYVDELGGLVTIAANAVTRVPADLGPVAQKYSVAITDGSGNANIDGTSSNTALVTPALADGKYRASVEVECVTAGKYNISFTNVETNAVVDKDFKCPGPGPGYVAVVDLSASESTVLGSESVITATLTDDDGNAAKAGGDVTFMTNNCEFGNGKNSEVVKSETDDGDTIAEVTLDCSKSTASAGPAKVIVTADKPGLDITTTRTVTVIGPPATLTVDASAMKENMVCGELVTLTINVIDAAGQPVANGTVINLTTNVAGVLVAPAYTSGGSATAYLITSNAHVGSYSVVAQSGLAAAHLTVSCEAAAAPAPVEAPAITPPSTGDAGLK